MKEQYPRTIEIERKTEPIVIQGMKERTGIRKTTVEKRLGVGGEKFPPQTKAILPIRVREKIYMITTEYSNDEIRKMSEDDFVYLKSKFYNTIYRNEFVKKGKPRTKRIVVQAPTETV